jgi:hypothetical protein
LQYTKAQGGSFLNPDAMLGQNGHVDLEQKFEILGDSGGPLVGHHPIETVTADIRSLVKTFVEELHGCRTSKRQDGRARLTCR